jgi:acetyl-CoA/propionyl-CoA carboxylase carboxyl transferase subunit
VTYTGAAGALSSPVAGDATARPLLWLQQLFDPGTAQPLARPGWDEDGSAVVTGRGQVEGNTVVSFATNGTLKGGALGAKDCQWIVQAISFARRHRFPVVGLWWSGGARIGESVAALDGLGRVFAAIVGASGQVPQISVVLGPAAGGAAYGPALTDVVVMSQLGRIFVTGPDIVRTVTGENVDAGRLGGPEPHSRHSGVAHVVAQDEGRAIAAARRVAVLLGVTGWHEDGPSMSRRPTGEADAAPDYSDPGAILPEQPRRAYDARPLVALLLDTPGIEFHDAWAPNIITTLGRLAGRTVGVIANNPLRLGGCLDALAADKAARFVRMCDALGVPLIVVVDVPGYLPGVKQEWDGVVRRGAKLLHAFAEARVPRVTLITRKAYGGAYIAMNSRALGATAVFAWPTAEIAVMGAAAAVEILHRRELAMAPSARREALRERLIRDHARSTGGLDRALAMGLVDEVISPAQTRSHLADALWRARPRRGDHSNIPL